ncbi:unnamed protein product [Alopecurus aequalis]
MSTDSAADPSRSTGRCPRSDLEEGEFVASDDDSTRSDGDDSRYVVQHRHGDDARPEIKRRRLAVVDGGALPPSCERDSDETVSDVDADADAASLAQELLFFSCAVFRKEFRSRERAACGHMRVQDPHGRQQGIKERALAISGGWAVTGKRGSVGRRSVSPQSQKVVDFMALPAPEPVPDPMPIASAGRSSSSAEEPNPPNDDSMTILVASSGNPTDQVVAHPPSSPQFLRDHKPAASQAVVAQGQQLAEAAPPQFVVYLPAAPEVVAPHVRRRSPRPPAKDEQGWWLCKEKGCDQRFTTYRGLGGHMAGHKNRQKNEAAATGLHVGVVDAACAKSEKLHYHPCKHCPRVFTSGYKLGGHMRMHIRKVIPKKGGARPKVSACDPASALTLSLPMPPAAMEVAPEQPAVAPGTVRIFGINIVPAGPPATEEVSSAVTETDQSSAASTNIEK